MEQGRAFGSCHPVVNFLYFAVVLVYAVGLMHPVSLGISLLSALLYSGMLRGWRALAQTGKFLLPVSLLAALLNPLFSHKGTTVLTYFPSGNPLTLESIYYGLAAAALLAGVLLWFTCWNEVLTAEKILYLFGRVAPALSLLLSMTLSFVPRFRAQLTRVLQAQRSLRGGEPPKGIRRRLEEGITVLSVLLTWSLENAVETADSMKSRGYGLPGRTAFSLYQLDRRDRGLLLWLILCGGGLTAGWAAGGFTYYYYPSTAGAWGPFPALLFLMELALCLTPVLLEGWEGRRWKNGNRCLSKKS